MRTRTAVVLMLGAAASVALAQLLFKPAAAALPSVTPLLIFGGLLYALGGLLMTLSFRGADVSLLYPCLATSYVWVSLGAYAWLGESLPPLRIAGVCLIVIGVCVLGWRRR